MPFRRGGFSRGRRRMGLQVVDSNKNVVDFSANPSTTIASTTLVLTKDTATNTVANEVSRGSKLFRIWLSFDICGLDASGVRQKIGLYLIKNPGTNFGTIPGVFVVGTSNEKKYVIKQWSYMTMRNQDGNPPNHWEGWIKIPKIYQRNGADDIWTLAFQSDTTTGHLTGQCIYKWFK